jgi:hypothetical protein
LKVSFNSKQFEDQAWRLNNLYFVVDKQGQRVPFRMNWAQEEVYRNLHSSNVILKARQLGISTLISLYMLDHCVFRSNVRAGTVAHDLPSAKGMFRDKIRYPFENLPEGLRNARAPLNDSSDELLLNNNSSLRIATSMRSSTLNLLHVSEFGKICSRYPERAREVITGSLNTLAPGSVCFIESTAEGAEGAFYEMCALAQTKRRMGKKLSGMESKFFFLPWFADQTYVAEPRALAPVFIDYFDKLKDLGISLSDEQKAWYAQKAETQFDDMKREFPSTADEATRAVSRAATTVNRSPRPSGTDVLVTSLMIRAMPSIAHGTLESAMRHRSGSINSSARPADCVFCTITR